MSEMETIQETAFIQNCTLIFKHYYWIKIPNTCDNALISLELFNKLKLILCNSFYNFL